MRLTGEYIIFDLFLAILGDKKDPKIEAPNSTPF